MREQLEQPLGCLAASHLRLNLLLASAVSHFVDKGACLVKSGGAARRARVTDVVTSASEGLELDSWYIVEV